ncbi:MAG: hypothetical protein BWY74_00782 [Firmicutes bacterium ADurb.Bin419]|nr:MAG: hypothetical protein BWY74_00782 [Firmicutes bacterium ADurb.Bin419]
MGTDFQQLVGLSGLTLVKKLVDYCRVGGIWAILLAMVFGVVLNVILSFLLKTELVDAIAVGALTGLAANFYNDYKVSKEI